MSISGVNGADLRGLFHQRRVDFKAMASAVESGDQTAAQTALQNYQKDVQTIDSAVGPTESSGSSDFAAQIKTDLSNLTSAVQSGSMSDAQTALKAYEQDKDALFQAASEQSGATAGTSGVQSDAAAPPKDIQSPSQSGGPGAAHHHHHHYAGPPPANVDGSTELSMLADAGSSAGAASSTSTLDTSQSTALSNLVKQLTDALEQFEQSTQRKTV